MTKRRVPKFNLEKLKEERGDLKYIEELTEKLRSKLKETLGSRDRLSVIRNTIVEVAKKSLS